MVADVKVKFNTIEVNNFIKRITRKQRKSITTALNNVSNMAVLMITKRTQSGKLPDGGKMIAYAKSTKKRQDSTQAKNIINKIFFLHLNNTIDTSY